MTPAILQIRAGQAWCRHLEVIDMEESYWLQEYKPGCSEWVSYWCLLLDIDVPLLMEVEQHKECTCQNGRLAPYMPLIEEEWGRGQAQLNGHSLSKFDQVTESSAHQSEQWDWTLAALVLPWLMAHKLCTMLPERHSGCIDTERFETKQLQPMPSGVPLLFFKYILRYRMGRCPIWWSSGICHRICGIAAALIQCVTTLLSQVSCLPDGCECHVNDRLRCWRLVVVDAGRPLLALRLQLTAQIQPFIIWWPDGHNDDKTGQAKCSCDVPRPRMSTKSVSSASWQWQIQEQAPKPIGYRCHNFDIQVLSSLGGSAGSFTCCKCHEGLHSRLWERWSWAGAAATQPWQHGQAYQRC